MASGVAEIGEVIQRVLHTEPASCDLGVVRARLDDTRRIEAFVAARAAAYRAVHERLLAEAAAAPPTDPSDEPAAPPPSRDGPADDVRPLPPESSRDTARERLRARWLLRCPLFADALHDAVVSPQLVDVLASTLDRVEAPIVAHVLGDEAGLVRLASRSTPEGFRASLRRLIDQARGDFGRSVLERQRRESKAWTRVDEDGMYRLSLTLDPERGPAVFDAITKRVNQLRAQTTSEQRSEADLRLQAVIDLIAGTATVVPEVVVIVDERTVRNGPHPATVCETEAGVTLPPNLAVNLCAQAKVTAAILDADGTVVASGCAQRTATREQRRVLRAMHRTCAHPDCAVPFTECVIHHVTHWEHGGPTEIPNLLPLCYEHHHLVHDGGWNVTIDTQRTLRWYRPDHTLDRTTPLAPLAQRHDLRPVDQQPPAAAADTGGPPPGRAPPRLFDPNAA